MGVHLDSETLQEAVQQHLLVQDLKQGVVQKQSLPAGALHKLVDDDGDDQVQHDEVHAKDEGDAVDGGHYGFPAGIARHVEDGAPLGLLQGYPRLACKGFGHVRSRFGMVVAGQTAYVASGAGYIMSFY